MTLKNYTLVILLVLPISLFSQNNLSLYNVNGWNYTGAYGYPDLPNIGMIIEEGPSDSVMRINSYGWTIRTSIDTECVLQTDFGKSQLAQPYYLWPDSVLIDINITNIENNVWFFGMLISLEDTTGDGMVTYLSHSIPIELGWQTISFWAGDGIFFENLLINGIGIHIATVSTDSGYVGVELQFNDMRLKYDDGTITLIEPFQYDWLTAVEPPTPIVPEFVLSQNYPNPFNPNTTIRYELPEFSSVRLTVYNLLGEEIMELVNSEQLAGVYEVPFDATNLASGTYIYVLQTKEFVLERKMILLK